MSPKNTYSEGRQAVFCLVVHGEQVWYTDGERALIAYESAEGDFKNIALFCGRNANQMKQIR